MGVSVWWSVALTALGGLGWLLVTVERRIQGFVVGLVAQVAWAAYAVTTEQWGFLGSVALFGAINTIGVLRWRNNHQQPPTGGWPAAPPWAEPLGLDPRTGVIHDVHLAEDGAAEHSAACHCRPTP